MRQERGEGGGGVRGGRHEEGGLEAGEGKGRVEA